MVEYVRQGNPNWKPGVSGNPSGRPRGAGNVTNQKHVVNALTQFAEWMADNFSFQLDPDSKYPESVQLLLALARSDGVQHSIRLGAATAVTRLEAQYLYCVVDIPAFESIDQAESFLLQLSKQEANREIDSRTVSTITNRVQGWINNKRADQEIEIKLLNAGQETGEQIIKIEGGLPPLPGPNITMPFNGHAVLEGNSEHALLNPQPGPRIIEHIEVSSPQIESTPEDPANGVQT